MQNDIDTVIRRTQGYWYVDGLGEIAIGVMLGLFGLSFLVFDLVPNGATELVVVFAQMLGFLGLWWLGGKAVRALKERLTYPRTGYVALPRKPRRTNRMVLAAIIAMLVSALVAFVQTAASSRAVTPILIGALLAISVAFLGRRFLLPRFYLLAAYALLVGATAGWLGLDDVRQSAFFFALFGLGWLVGGAVTLARYLAATRPAGEDDPA